MTVVVRMVRVRGIPRARIGVVAQAWFAKTNGWNTHYTKFGPAGIERPMDDTMTI